MIKRIRDDAALEAKKSATFPLDEENGALPRFRFAERLSRNLALAGMALLCITAARSAQWPQGEGILAAVQGIVDAPWDDSLGKISFVSALFPETVSVFFDTAADAQLVSPCFGEVSHAYTDDEPYLGYTARDDRVFAAAPGQVMSLAHGNGEEYVVRIRHEDGIETLYYGLAALSVREGDQVTEQTCLGTALSPDDIWIEVRRAGRAIDPTALLTPRTEAAP